MKNKKILILGGTGALGKTLLKLYQNDNIIKVFSRDEHKHVNLISSDWVKNDKVSFIIGDVKDKNSVQNVLEDFKPDIVINAAALKHVPVCEINPFESVNVNIIGHQNLLEAVRRSTHKIETLIYISSDKACKPVNIYGMCKAISEKLYIEFAKKQTDIKVCLVRYGNVLESTGSVIPFFKELIKQGKDSLPITDFRMTRFLLTLEEAANLIEWAYTSPHSHGKIAIPKVQSFKIVDIAKALSKHYKGSEDELTLRHIGVREGEKLHEEMISSEEWMRTEEYENYLIGSTNIREQSESYNSLDAAMDGTSVYDFLVEKKVLLND